MTLSGFLRVLPAFCLLCLAPAVYAAPDVRVVGLFSDRAVIVIDVVLRPPHGTARPPNHWAKGLLRTGQTSPEGVKLVTADSESAVLQIEGKQIEVRLDGRVSARKRSASVREFQVWRNTAGMYTTVGSINSLPVSFLVDTGATQVAMNSGEARRLGIDYRVTGTPASVTTACRRRQHIPHQRA